MKYAAAFMALLLAACADASGPDLSQAADRCHYGSRPFIEAWPCVRDTFATRQDDNPGIQATFLAKGDLIWQRAKEGQLTEPQARAEIRLAAAQAREAEDRANAARSANGAAVMSGMRPYSPPPTQPQMQTIVMPNGRIVNCIPTGNMTNCY